MIRRLQTLAWDGGYLLRGLFDLLRWPFERAFWAFERLVVWPLGERASARGVSPRPLALASLGALAAVALVAGAISAGGGADETPVVAAPVSAPVKTAAPKPAPEPVEPTLQGAPPDFGPEEGDAAKASLADADTVIASKSAKGSAEPGSSSSATPSSSSPATASSSAVGKKKAQNPGPAAIEVARRFSGAFVLYETGQTDAEVRKTLSATTAPRLLKALLRRPPRLPENVKVPKAKVLNVVPGPRRGDTFTLSASLLRVGVTSELRIDVHREDESGRWQVTDVLG
jgi:hypothetical protein